MAQHILVVDDDPDFVGLLSHILRRAGYQVAIALSGRAALERVRQVRPDLIVLDVMMPEMNGYEVARRLRAQQGTITIPIVMVTARALLSDHVTGLQVSATAYLAKPVLPYDVVRTIRRILGGNNFEPSPRNAD